MSKNVTWDSVLHKDDLDRLAHIPEYHTHVVNMCIYKFIVGVLGKRNLAQFYNHLAEITTDLYCVDHHQTRYDYYIVRFASEKDAMTFKMTDWAYLIKN